MRVGDQGRELHLRSRKLRDGKRTKVDPQLISDSQRIKTAAEGSGPDLWKPDADFRWVGHEGVALRM